MAAAEEKINYASDSQKEMRHLLWRLEERIDLLDTHYPLENNKQFIHNQFLPHEETSKELFWEVAEAHSTWEDFVTNLKTTEEVLAKDVHVVCNRILRFSQIKYYGKMDDEWGSELKDSLDNLDLETAHLMGKHASKVVDKNVTDRALHQETKEILGVLNRERTSLKTEKEKTQEELELTKLKHDHLQSEFEEMRTELERKRRQTSQLKKDLLDRNAKGSKNQEEINQLKQRIKELEKDLDLWKEKYACKAHALEYLQARIQTLEMSMKYQEKEILSQERINQTLKKQNESLKGTVEQVNQRLLEHTQIGELMNQMHKYHKLVEKTLSDRKEDETRKQNVDQSVNRSNMYYRRPQASVTPRKRTPRPCYTKPKPDTTMAANKK